nr:MarR family winged helix-turn-helix transcriptional regulator [Mycolicibacterium mengxianglii]
MGVTERADLEGLIATDVRALSAESEQIGRSFAASHDLTMNDFRALVHVMVADDGGAPLTAGELRKRMGVSASAITYLVERMIASGHLRRESDPRDRRKVILRYDEHGMAVARGFFTPLAQHTHTALAELPDEDLAAAHRVFAALADAMRAFQVSLG